MAADFDNLLHIMTHAIQHPQRVAYDFAEFAKLFGKDRAWTYRLVRQGKLKPLLGYGKMMIPAAEIERIITEAREVQP